jgi:hypothetical protein
MPWASSHTAPSHAAELARRLRAAPLLLALACSGPTDIVGVIDGAEPSAAGAPGLDATDETAIAPANDDAADAEDVALLLAGRPMLEWPGQALEWPLSMPLAELFADAPSGGRDARDRTLPAPWPSRRVAAGFARASARGTSDVDARSTAFDARLLILDAEDAQRLLALMTPAGNPGVARAAVFRDALGDVYEVSLESDEMPFDGVGCSGRMRREPFECTERGPFD